MCIRDRERVKSVMNYKKPAFWIVVLAVIACVAVAVCFLTNPLSETMNHTSVYAGNYKLSELLYTNKSGPVTLYGQYRITNDYQLYVRNAGYEWSLVQQMEKYPLTVDELKEYADYDNGWHQKYRVRKAPRRDERQCGLRPPCPEVPGQDRSGGYI